MPGELLDYPLALPTPRPGPLAYEWVRVVDGSSATGRRGLGGGAVVVPERPGIYRLAVTGAAGRRVLDGFAVAVLTPFAEKLGGTINGYRIGSYPFERFGGERPAGFVEVTPVTAALPLSRTLRLADFVTHDAQRQWPRYVAVSPQLVDKIELVVDEVARVFRDGNASAVRVNVHSGFRTPLHNRGVEGAAFNSRHQYGDALDLAIDADGDGRFTALDAQMAAMAAEMVERRHPELTGGLGLYTGGATPYVHIDVRGRKARWWRRLR